MTQQDASLDSIRSDPSDDELHICPCHPDVRNQGPGLCPECGMALEPKRPPGLDRSGLRYTCPMHPKVVSDEPGLCPECGMALEPMGVTAEEPPNPELVDMSRRFRVSLSLAVPVLLLAMSEIIPGRPVKARASRKAKNVASDPVQQKPIFSAHGMAATSISARRMQGSFSMPKKCTPRSAWSWIA